MKDQSTKTIFRINVFLVCLAFTMSMAVMTETTKAKSLYVLTDIEVNPQPLQAYDIGMNGDLIFQTEHYIPRIELGAVGLAIDSDNGYLFITYEDSPEIYLVEGKTMTSVGSVTAADAVNLAGIVYDHEKELLYCVDRGMSWLYVYRWDAINVRLMEVANSPFNLRRASAYGIALDEIEDILYVANGTNEINAYRTSDWELERTITVSRVAISVAVDVKNGFLYSGGGYADNHYLTQYYLAGDTEREVQVEPDAGVMGLGVDSDTGLVYMSTGTDQWPGGDNLLIYNASLQKVGKIPSIGNKPTGLAVPVKNFGYNPLNLAKDIIEGASVNSQGQFESVGAGGQITYNISFDNAGNNYDVTGLVIEDTLPSEVSFISADEDGITGEYDSIKHTYTWRYPSLSQGNSNSLDLKVQIKDKIEPGTSFTNYVAIHSNEIPQSTIGVEVHITSNPLYIKKSVSGTLTGQTKMVDPNESITYRIHFNNNDNDFRATEVTIVDILPKELSFVKADYDLSLGFYNVDTHTYTWSYAPLEPGDSTAVELTAQVKPYVVPGTVITNVVTIDSEQTPETASSVDVITSGVVNRFNLSKSVVGTIAEVERIALNEEVTYCICFDGNDIAQKIMNVSLIDFLPDQVSFISADGDGIIGHYDENTHTYIWSYPFISPGQVVRLELTVKINEDVALGKTITNLVTIDGDETPPTTASVDIITDEGGWQVDNLEMIPSVIRRDGTLTGIMAVLTLSEDVGIDDVNNEELLILHPGKIEARQQFVKEEDGRTMVIAVFDKSQVMDAIPGYGEFDIEIVGKFKSGQSFYGEAKITITRFASN